jgi:cysteine desulfurase/selenocysteine lyase
MKPIDIETILNDSDLREKWFPIVRHQVFLGHAAVCPLSGPAVEALMDFGEHATRQHQEAGGMMARMNSVRKSAAGLIGASAHEVALLGPTALGLNLVANGFPWQPGDEVIYYPEDYPSNVYPWTALAERCGVVPVALRPAHPGQIDWPLIERAITPRTRMVALASAHYLTGYRIDIGLIGRQLQERNIRFCLDAIQTLGAFPTDVSYVDYLSADSHKWLLGPMGAGIFYVKESRFDELKPSLLGSWNVVSPEFIAQEKVDFYDGARRYEPGSLNLAGNLAMEASMELVAAVGVEAISDRLIHLRHEMVERMTSTGFEVYPRRWEDHLAAGMVSFRGASGRMEALPARLAKENIAVSFRQDRSGETFMRLSPHFYNTVEELDRLIEVIETVDFT